MPIELWLSYTTITIANFPVDLGRNIVPCDAADPSCQISSFAAIDNCSSTLNAPIPDLFQPSSAYPC